MRVFKNKWFNKWARGKGIEDEVLWTAAAEIVAGIFDADLGKCLYKKRVARQNQGTRGGFRVLVAYKKPNSDRIFYVDAFEKSDKPNLTPKEFEALGMIAPNFIKLNDKQIEYLKRLDDLVEIEEP